MSKIALGRGLEALIPTGSDDDAGLPGDMIRLPLDKVAPNPLQPRKSFDPESLSELADSIKTKGLLQPILVKRDGDGFLLVAGERRFRASRIAGLEKVPALVMEDIDESEMLQIALVENLQREDLNPIETADAYKSLMDKCNFTQVQLAQKLGKTRTAVANTLRLLTLPGHIKELVVAGKLSEGHARAVLSVTDPAMRDRVTQRIMQETLSVRQAEKLARKSGRRRLTVRRKSPILEEAETFLKHTLGTAVKIIPGLKKGRIEIEYYGNEDLTRLLEMFRKIS